MCGIVGGIWSREAHERPARFSRALQQLRRRGPDDCAIADLSNRGRQVLLGHARLSVIAPGPGGRQPMQSADGRHWITFNGEIYNFQELRRELESAGRLMTSLSDSEVLLQSWIHWGESCLNRLVGMFAFAVYDTTSDELTCVRDAFGIKPFLYHRDPGSFLFASDLRALQGLMDGRPALNHQRAYDYLAHGDYDSQEQTFVEDVLHLRPGHLLRVRLDRSPEAPVRWWRPRVTPERPVAFATAAQTLRAGILESVRLQLRSDVPIGVMLSGGIDSSTIVCAMRHLEPDLPIHTFSYVARGFPASEERWIDLVNDHVGAVAHKVEASASDLADDLDDMIVAQGEPFGSTSIYAQYRVFKLAREQGVTVTLDGQGADELVAGYAGYPRERLRSLLDAGQPHAALSFLWHWARWPGRSLPAGVRALLEAAAGNGPGGRWLRRRNAPDAPAWLGIAMLRDYGVRLEPPWPAFPDAPPGRCLVAALAEACTDRGLPALLRHGDRNSMRFSVESRVPFLATDLADFLLTLPEEHLVSSRGETKRILRAAMRGIVPDEVLERRDKIGFVTPEQAWLRQLAPLVRGWLSDEDGPSFLHSSPMLAELEEMMAGRRPFTSILWRMINFKRWHAHFITGMVT